MLGYIIANIEVHDPEGMKAYSAKVPAVIKKFGGRYLARGTPMTSVEGQFPFDIVTMLEFPSLEAAQKFWASEEYAECKALRQKCSVGRVAMYAAAPGENPIPGYLAAR